MINFVLLSLFRFLSLLLGGRKTGISKLWFLLHYGTVSGRTMLDQNRPGFLNLDMFYFTETYVIQG